MVGNLGSASLGAGVTGLVLVNEAPKYLWALLFIGAIALGAAWRMLAMGAGPVRVGPIGVTLERGDEFTRLRWCEITRVHVENESLLIVGAEQTLSLDLRAHGKAVACVVKEAASRIPDHLDLSPAAHNRLPRLQDSDGELTAALPLQVAGEHFQDSDALITLQRDARLCSKCAALYPKADPPKTCKVCQQPLAGHLLPV